MTKTDSAAAATLKRRRIHWKTGATILVVGLAAQAAAWIWIAPDRTYRIMSILYVVPATLFLLLLWWTFISGFSWRTRLIGLGVVGALVGGFFAATRVETYEGDMLPRFAWRWSPTAEDRAAAWREAQSRRERPPIAAASADEEADDDSTGLEADGEDWPRFRGADGDSIVRGVRLNTDWEQHPPREVWRHPVGLGWSSFAVVDRYVFTQEQHGEQEAVVAYDRETGDLIWIHTDNTRFSSTLGGDGPRATPTFHDGRLYTLGATGILNCLDPETGRPHWSTNILADAGVENISWGMAASPLVYDDVVVVNPGGNASGNANGAVAAYDRITGEKQWAHGDRPASYCTPQLVTLGGERQLLIFDGLGLFGHDPQDGRKLWGFDWTNDPEVNAAQPLVLAGNTIFISSGYAQGAALVEVNRTGDDWTAGTTGWERSRDFKAKFNDFVPRDGFVYGMDEGILCCFDLSSGKRRWKRGRYGYGQLLLVDDLLLILGESGEVVLVEATPEQHREVARFQAISGKTWNHPVLIGDRLLVRNGEEAACYEVPLASGGAAAE